MNDASDLPKAYQKFVLKFPQLDEAHKNVAQAVENAGPLEPKTRELIKMGISIGAGLVTATKSHAHRAQEAGATEAEIEQAILLAMNTCGFPRTVAAWQWVTQSLESTERNTT